MHRVLILGAGKIGALISGLLAESGGYRVQLGDVDGAAAEAVVRAHGAANLAGFSLDATDGAALARQLAAQPVDAIISSLPYYCNTGVAEAARKAGAHYFDLTEDVAVTHAVRAIARGAAHAFVPQCGLAPGFISIAAAELITHFDELRAVKLRVGALPQHPNNVLKYSLTWSTEGLINEYGNPCQAVTDGRLLEVAPLEGLEEIEIDGTVIDEYVGRYRFSKDDAVTITREENHLVVVDDEAGRDPYYPKSSLTFFSRSVDSQVAFKVDSQGRAVELMFHFGGGQTKLYTRIR